MAMIFDCPNEFDTVEMGEAAHLMAAGPPTELFRNIMGIMTERSVTVVLLLVQITLSQ